MLALNQQPYNYIDNNYSLKKNECKVSKLEVCNMVKLTRLNNQEFYVNSELIEFIESTPDTMISLTTGKKMMVRESVDDVLNRILDFKVRCLGITIDTPR